MFQFVPPWCFAEQLAAHRHQPMMPWSLIDIPQLWLHVAAINPRTEQTQLLDGPAFAIAMERLRLAGYDHIVVDAPPVLGSADVNLMTDAADTVVFALRARRSNTRDLRRVDRAARHPQDRRHRAAAGHLTYGDIIPWDAHTAWRVHAQVSIGDRTAVVSRCGRLAASARRSG